MTTLLQTTLPFCILKAKWRRGLQ